MSKSLILEARRLRPFILKASANLDDKDASQCALLFRRLWGTGSLIPSGTRINWNGTVKRAAVDLWDTEQNSPDNAPSLWEDIGYREGIRIIPNSITAGTAFVKDEKGYWGEDIYTSLLDYNVWNPEQYPSGWSKDE